VSRGRIVRRGLPAAIVAASLPALVGFDPYVLYVGGMAWLWAALATAWGLLAVAGQVSFGQAAYFGAGAYTSALLAQRGGLSPWLGIPCAVAVGGAIAVPVGLATRRLQGAYLALGTLGYAETLRLVSRGWTGLTGGGSGLVGLPGLSVPAMPGIPEASLGRAAGYYASLALLAAALGLAAAARRGRVGLAWAAIREREERAAQLGVAATPYKLLAFVCAGAVTGAGGAVYAHAVRYVEPDLVFGRAVSILPLVMATFGGPLALLGPAAGALVLYLASELLFQPLMPRLHQLPYALALVLTLLAFPRGLASLRRRP
jgi:branched-chain amino acid transport system permease protein